MTALSKWKISAYLAALFAAGAVTGSVVTWKIARQTMSRPPGGKAMAAHWCQELREKLDLNDEQVRQIEPILNDSMSKFQSALADQMLTSMTNCNRRIRAVLTTGQQAKFTEIEQQQIDFIRKHIQNEH